MDDDDDCRRSAGSYAPQLHSDWLYDGEDEFNFIACTGDKTGDVINNQLDQISSDPEPDLVLMTIGGNDIAFSTIVKACLVGIWFSGGCDEKINE